MYAYADFRKDVLTDEGQRNLLRVRDAAHALLKEAGAFRLGELLARSGIGGDSWMQLAFVDRLVELGEIREIPQPNCATQHKVFIKKGA